MYKEYEVGKKNDPKGIEISAFYSESKIESERN